MASNDDKGELKEDISQQIEPSSKRIKVDSSSSNNKELIDFMKEIHDELEIVKSRNKNYFGPSIFIHIYNLGSILNKAEFDELVKQNNEFREWNEKIIALFKDNFDWLGKFIKRMPFCYFSGNYEAEQVFKTISGIKFTFELWSEVFGNNSFETWQEEPIEWWKIFEDAWIPTDKTIEEGPSGHWWWGIPKGLINQSF
jgi:hypothetical protein